MLYRTLGQLNFLLTALVIRIALANPLEHTLPLPWERRTLDPNSRQENPRIGNTYVSPGRPYSAKTIPPALPSNRFEAKKTLSLDIYILIVYNTSITPLSVPLIIDLSFLTSPHSAAPVSRDGPYVGLIGQDAWICQMGLSAIRCLSNPARCEPTSSTYHPAGEPLP